MNLIAKKKNFTILGIHFNSKLENMEEINFDQKIGTLERDIQNWAKRNLTVLGKITVIKSLLLPKLTHLFLALPTPSKETIKRIENIFYKFIGNEKQDRVARLTMIQDYKNGRCGMTQNRNIY